MYKILIAAAREFRSTVLTKAFFFGVILFPLIILGGITLITSLGLLSSEKSAITGEIAVADTTDSQIVLRCTFHNTTSSVVRWGDGTNDEMCLAAIYRTTN